VTLNRCTDVSTIIMKYKRFFYSCEARRSYAIYCIWKAVGHAQYAWNSVIVNFESFYLTAMFAEGLQPYNLFFFSLSFVTFCILSTCFTSVTSYQ